MIRPNSPCCASVAASPPALVHQIEPASVPTRGLQLERRYVLGRGTDGQPVLWTQRRRLPLLAPPAPHLRFDVMRESSA